LLKARQPYTASDLQQQEQAVAAAAAQLHKAENPYTRPDLAAAQAAVDGAQAQLDAAQLQLAESTIAAPVDGVVAERMVAPGALVSPQTPLMTLVPPSLEVVVNVDESHVGQLAKGQSVELEVAAFPGQAFAAQVASISPTLDAKTRTATVHVQPNDTDTGLRAGMFAQLSIITAQKRNVVLVPSSAVASGDSQSRVVVIDSTNIARLQPVKLGLETDGFAEVLTGLDAGQLVVTSGVANLHDGEVVAPRTDTLAALAQAATQ